MMIQLKSSRLRKLPAELRAPRLELDTTYGAANWSCGTRWSEMPPTNRASPKVGAHPRKTRSSRPGILIPSFFLNDPAHTESYTLSLHDALPHPDDAGERAEAAAPL